MKKFVNSPKTPTLVYDNLYLGCAPNLHCRDIYSELKIVAIVNCTTECENYFGNCTICF